MKRFFVIFLAILGIFLLTPKNNLNAIEVEISGGFNNQFFGWEKTESLEDDIWKFGGNPFYLGKVGIKGIFSEKFGYNVSLERDPLLHYNLTGSVLADLDYLTLEVGSFIGIMNTEEKPLNAGVIGGLRLAYPGVVFVSFKGASSINIQYEFPGDYSIESAEINLGIWLPYVIPSVSAKYKNFSRLTEDDLLIRDEFTRYQASLDFHIKNMPFTFRIDYAYIFLTRTFKDKKADSDVDIIFDEINAMNLGGEINWNVSKAVRIYTGFEAPVFLWAQQPIRKMIESDTFFFQINAGIVFNF